MGAVWRGRYYWHGERTENTARALHAAHAWRRRRRRRHMRSAHKGMDDAKKRHFAYPQRITKNWRGVRVFRACTTVAPWALRISTRAATILHARHAAAAARRGMRGTGGDGAAFLCLLPPSRQQAKFSAYSRAMLIIPTHAPTPCHRFCTWWLIPSLNGVRRRCFAGRTNGYRGDAAGRFRSVAGTPADSVCLGSFAF